VLPPTAGCLVSASSESSRQRRCIKHWSTASRSGAPAPLAALGMSWSSNVHQRSSCTASLCGWLVCLSSFIRPSHVMAVMSSDQRGVSNTHTNIQHCGLKGCGLKAAPVPTSNAPMPMQASDQQAPVSVSPTASQLPPASTQPPLPSQQTGISYPSFGHTSSHSPRHIQLEIPLATPSVSVHRPSGSQAQPFTTPPSMSQHALSDQQVRSRHHRHSHG
jgi:hypothetical protein